MKKTIITLAFLLCAVAVFGQNKQEVIRLKNGSTLKGTVVGEVDGVLSGQTPAEILNAQLYFIDRIGLHEHLSPTRSNGLVSMVKQMRIYALAFSAQQ